MSDAQQSSSLSLDQLCTLAIEHWRLSRALGASMPVPARHALRKMEELLTTLGVKAECLDDLPHDPGMSAKVVDRMEDDSLDGDRIVETISPLVLVKGRMVRQAEVVVAGPGKTGK